MHRLTKSFYHASNARLLCFSQTVTKSPAVFQMSDFLEDTFLKEQVESIREIGGFITNLKKVGPGLGEYQFDKETLQEWAWLLSTWKASASAANLTAVCESMSRCQSSWRVKRPDLSQTTLSQPNTEAKQENKDKKIRGPASKSVSNLVFYAQSTITVISEWKGTNKIKTGLCLKTSQHFV